LPTSAATATSHTALLRAQLPIRSSQGLKASGSGWHDTSRGERDKLPQYAWISRWLREAMPWWNTPLAPSWMEGDSATTWKAQSWRIRQVGACQEQGSEEDHCPQRPGWSGNLQSCGWYGTTFKTGKHRQTTICWGTTRYSNCLR
jgi:hypothetical protein